jgi:hypothetical protein
MMAGALAAIMSNAVTLRMKANIVVSGVENQKVVGSLGCPHMSLFYRREIIFVLFKPCLL